MKAFVKVNAEPWPWLGDAQERSVGIDEILIQVH